MPQLTPLAAGTRVAETIITEIVQKHKTLSEGGSKAFLDAKAKLKAVGMHIHKTGYGDEYRVVHQDDKHNPDIGNFTDDLEDAVSSGLHMASQGSFLGSEKARKEANRTKRAAKKATKIQEGSDDLGCHECKDWAHSRLEQSENDQRISAPPSDDLHCQNCGANEAAVYRDAQEVRRKGRNARLDLQQQETGE